MIRPLPLVLPDTPPALTLIPFTGSPASLTVKRTVFSSPRVSRFVLALSVRPGSTEVTDVAVPGVVPAENAPKRERSPSTA